MADKVEYEVRYFLRRDLEKMKVLDINKAFTSCLTAEDENAAILLVKEGISDQHNGAEAVLHSIRENKRPRGPFKPINGKEVFESFFKGKNKAGWQPPKGYAKRTSKECPSDTTLDPTAGKPASKKKARKVNK